MGDINIIKSENNFKQSVWALQCVCKEDSYPNTLFTVFLPLEANMMDATKIMAEDIKQEYYDRTDDEGAKDIDKLKNPKKILHFMNYNNNRSLSYYVVQIYPPSKYNLQKEY